VKTIIQNGIVVTMDQQMQVWDHGYVIIDGTKIVEAGPESELKAKKAAMTQAGEVCQEKDARSHRGKAFEEFERKLKEYLKGLEKENV